MDSYKLHSDGSVRKNGRGTIPQDPQNRDWRKYQAWLADGNTPDPADPPRIPSNKEKRKEDSEFPELQDFMEAILDANPSDLNRLKADFVNVKARNP